MRKIITLFLSILFLFTKCNIQTPTKGDLEEGFIKPPIESRPLAFWDWLNGYVDTSKLVFELEKMKAKGMQGAFICLYQQKNQPPGSYSKWLVINCGPSWARTSDPLIMSKLFTTCYSL